MKSRHLLVLFVSILFMFLVGCSGTADEKDIKEDLTTYSGGDLLEKGETIEKIVIDQRKTDKKQNEDTVWCNVTIEDSKISTEKEMVLFYHKYDKDGWLLDEVDVEDSDNWEVVPLKGITVKDIPETLDGEIVEVDGSKWEIAEKEVGDVVIDKQETNLEKKTDKITMSITLNGKVMKAKGKLTVNYKLKMMNGKKIKL